MRLGIHLGVELVALIVNAAVRPLILRLFDGGWEYR